MSRLELMKDPIPGQEAYEYHNRDDEIRLIDLVRVLIDRKKTLLSVFALFFIGGLLMAIFMSKQYRYSSTIEIGRISTKDDTRLIGKPSTLLAKIQQTYIPVALHHYYNAHPDDNRKYKINAYIPKNSTVIVLGAKGKKAEGEIYKNLLKDVIAQVVTDHNQLMQILRKEYQVNIEKMKNVIANYSDEMKVLHGRQQRLEDNKKLITKQIEQTRKVVKEGIANRQKASQRVQGATRAMTLMMIDNEVQQDRNHLDSLEEKLTVTLANQKDAIDKQLADTQRKIAEAKLALAKEQLELQNMRNTRALEPPMRSVKPVSVSRVVVLLLVIILGFFVSLIAVFLHELIIKTRQELAHTEYKVAEEYAA